MSFVRFKKVNNEINLPSQIVDGSLYLVIDTNKIFADFNGERHSFSISPNDISGYVQDSLEDSLEDFKNSLDAIEATLDEDVEENYEELKNNLRTIGQYSKTTEITAMIDEATNVVSSDYGTFNAGIIKLNKNHKFYKANVLENNNISIDIADISATDDVINFILIIENGDTHTPDFAFNPITLDTSRLIEYNHKYTMLELTGIRNSGSITWLISSKGGWN